MIGNLLWVAGPGSRFNLPGARAAGFWAGLWHGLISPLTFFVSLFTTNVRIYEVNNRGRLYDFGFICGASVAFGGSASRVCPKPYVSVA